MITNCNSRQSRKVRPMEWHDREREGGGDLNVNKRPRRNKMMREKWRGQMRKKLVQILSTTGVIMPRGGSSLLIIGFSRSSIIILFARTCRGSGKWLENGFRPNLNGNQCIERRTTKGSFLPVIRTVYCYATEGRRMARAELVTSEGQPVPADFS